MIRNNLFALSAMILASTTLVACELDDNNCTTDEECDGYVCSGADGETDGTCLDSCESNNDCASGFSCDANGECVQATTADCTTDDDCDGAYACADNGSCFASCTDGSECKDGAQCNEDGTCEAVAADPFLYAAVVSTCDTPGDLDNTTPGPDIDAVELEVGGTPVYAVIENFNIGAGGDDEDGNTHDDAATAGGAPDTNCDPDEDGYYSLGDSSGYFVVSFGTTETEITDGSTLTVYELSTECNDDIPTREDSFAMYITNDADEATNPGSANAIAANWCWVGDSASTGGDTTATIDLSTCQ